MTYRCPEVRKKWYADRYYKRVAERKCTNCGDDLPAQYSRRDCEPCLVSKRKPSDDRREPHRLSGVTPVRKAPENPAVQYFESTGRKFVVRMNDYYFGTIWCTTEELFTDSEVGVLGRLIACPIEHVPAKQRTALERAVAENTEVP